MIVSILFSLVVQSRCIARFSPPNVIRSGAVNYMGSTAKSIRSKTDLPHYLAELSGSRFNRQCRTHDSVQRGGSEAVTRDRCVETGDAATLSARAVLLFPLPFPQLLLPRRQFWGRAGWVELPSCEEIIDRPFRSVLGEHECMSENLSMVRL